MRRPKHREVSAPVSNPGRAGLGELLLIGAEPDVEIGPLFLRDVVAPLYDVDAEKFPALDSWVPCSDTRRDRKVHVRAHLGHHGIDRGRALRALALDDLAQW